MGNKFSGNRDERGESLNKRFKVYGLTDPESDHYWYLGISKQFLCNVKSYLSWRSKTDKDELISNSQLMRKIRSVKYFEIKLIELLPRDWDFEKSKLYLQTEYLDKYGVDCNTNTFCFCNRASEKPMTPRDIRLEICKKYEAGIKSKELAVEYNLSRIQITNMVRSNKSGKSYLFERAKSEYNGNNIEYLIEKYNLSDYMVKKLTTKQ